MKCPVDDRDLVMSERQGIEIDYCPECRGVWLDRGELDKIVERAARDLEPERDRRDRDRDEPRYRDEPKHREPKYVDPKYIDPKYARKKKRESFLSELFEFGG